MALEGGQIPAGTRRVMVSNYGEKQFTRFFNDQLKIVLSKKMRRLGFPIGRREKSLSGKKFDLWFHKRRVGFVIVECEMVGWYDHHNIAKLDEIGMFDWRWRPKVLLFQVFSPKYSRGASRLEEKQYSIEKAKKLHTNTVISTTFRSI